MNRIISVPLLIGLLTLTNRVAFPQDSTRREKVAEGEYSGWQDGHALKGTALTWTVWRTNDGLEVEAKLPANRDALWLAWMGAASESPELRREIQSSSTTTSIDLQLTKQAIVRRMILEGRSLGGDFKPIRVADCQANDNEVSCKGREGSVRLKSESPQLVYSYPFPLSFTPILKNHNPVPNQAIAIKLAMLEEVKNKLRLMEVPGELRAEGAEKLTIGEYTFDTEKYLLVLATKAGARKITLWTRNHETVFAMEDSLLAPGLRVTLSQYKRYSDF